MKLTDLAGARFLFFPGAATSDRSSSSWTMSPLSAAAVASAILARYAFMSADDSRDSTVAFPPAFNEPFRDILSPSPSRRNVRTSSIRRLSIAALISCASLPVIFATRSMVTRRCSVLLDIMSLSLHRPSVSVAAV